MHEFADWSVGLGRYQGVPVRVHLLYVLFAVVLLALASARAPDDVAHACYLAIGALSIALAAHEVGHLLATWQLGGYVDEVVIGPFGGLVRPTVHEEPAAQANLALSGILANLMLATACAVTLFLWHGEAPWGLLHPLVPNGLLNGDWVHIALRLSIWLNWLLAMINLLPVFPFDGAVLYRAVLRPVLGRASAATYVARSGYLTSMLFLLLAWLYRDAQSASVFPVWAPLVLAAVFTAFSAHRDVFAAQYQRSHAEYDERRLIEDCIQRAMHDDDDGIFSAAALVPQWKDAASLDGTQDEGSSSLENSDDEHLDDVLRRLHDSGYEALSPADRKFLQQASERYRNKRSKS